MRKVLVAGMVEFADAVGLPLAVMLDAWIQFLAALTFGDTPPISEAKPELPIFQVSI
jgi:hypothetical protein